MIQAILEASAAVLIAQVPAAAPVGPNLSAQAQSSIVSSRTEDNRRIVTAAFDRWQAGGTDFFTEMLAPDVIWTIGGSGPSAGVYRGRDDIIARAARPLAVRLSKPNRPVSKSVWADGDHVIINWVGEGTARDGRPYRNTYVWIFRMADGKAVEVKAFLDLTAFDDVLRRIPAPDGESARRRP